MTDCKTCKRNTYCEIKNRYKKVGQRQNENLMECFDYDPIIISIYTDEDGNWDWNSDLL